MVEAEIESRTERVMEITKDDALLLLESLKCHADEGWYLLGHYGGQSNSSLARQLGRRLCEATSIPVAGRSWLED